jgi:hypothetical protein
MISLDAGRRFPSRGPSPRLPAGTAGDSNNKFSYFRAAVLSRLRSPVGRSRGVTGRINKRLSSIIDVTLIVLSTGGRGRTNRSSNRVAGSAKDCGRCGAFRRVARDVTRYRSGSVEMTVCKASEALGYYARHIGGHAAPDGYIDAPLGQLGYRVMLECKTSHHGDIRGPYADKLAKYVEDYGAVASALRAIICPTPLASLCLHVNTEK